ncbi:MAG TPA: RodZ domain-containing protein [Burkholderiales bacterium]|nr:RodZ domain-containing protein [Burkholderiales bacterium]
MSDTASPESAAPPSKSAAGAMLLSERRRQGLSLGDISRQLKLSVRQVEALERDDYSGYKSPVFIHGFIRNYAKLLGLDPEPLIRATDSMLNPPPVAVAAPTPIREPDRRQPASGTDEKPRLWPAAAIVVVVAIALFIAFGAKKRPKDSQQVPAIVASRDKAVAPSKAVVATKSPAETVPADTKSEAKPKPETEAPARPAAKPEPKAADARPPVKKEAVEKVAPAEPGGVVASGSSTTKITVRMVFEQDSWVEIKDRNGNTIFGQLNSSGSTRRASGEPPLTVVVGNAAGVRLYQGDKNIDLVPFTRVDVARLTVE